MNIKEKVLLIEDERTIRRFMQAILTANGYDVLMAGTGAMADTMISSHCPDIIILDLGLPDMDGMTILRNVRKWSKVPILVVSARSHERDKVEALDAGADDYLTKPFGTEELLARIRAAVRHTRTPDGATSVANSGVFTAGDLTIDYAKHHVYIAGRDANLTQNEYKLVALLGLRIDFGSVSGMLCGSMANPMALNYANDTIEGDNPSVSYATVYPLCMFLRVIIIQVMLMIFL